MLFIYCFWLANVVFTVSRHIFPASRSVYFAFRPADVFNVVFRLTEMSVLSSAFVSCLLYFSHQTFFRLTNVYARANIFRLADAYFIYFLAR